MRLTFTGLTLIITVYAASAQSDIPFGHLSAEEVNMKECSFDPEASAVVLRDVASANYNDDYALLAERHLRIKILRQDGIKHADVSVPYYSKDQFEFLHDIEAVTINIDEKGNREEFKVEKKAIFFKKINEYYSEMTFAFPQARVGSVLEYRYRSTMKTYGGLRDWYFQSTIPVCFSAYEFRPAPHLEFTYQVQKKESYPIVVKRPDREGVVYFEMKNIPGLGDEPYMDSREDYVQKIRFQITKYASSYGSHKYMSSWNEVARELTSHSDFGGELKVNIPEDQKLLLVSLADKPAFDKMRAVYGHIQNNYQWNGFTSIYGDPGLKTLYSKKTGNVAQINLALVNLLREAGLEAYPMIVSERKHGKIDTKIPFLSQFNNTYAAVIIGGKQYYLNATDQGTPAHLIPQKILNTTALIIKRNTGILTEIKEDRLGYQDYIYINAVMSAEGKLAGKVQTISRDYARIDRLSDYTEDLAKYSENLKKGAINIDIDSIDIRNKETDTLALEESFSFKTGVQTTDEYYFLHLSMFTGLETNPFITKERFSNINFGYRKTITLNNIIQVSPAYVIEALPKSVRLVNTDRTVNFTREVFYSAETSQLVARIKVDFTKSEYTADEYPDVKEFFKKMTDLLNEQVVLKKKS